MKNHDTRILTKPGDTIQETIDKIGMSQRELAERIGYQASKLNQLIKGEIAITRDMAGKLETVLDIDALTWMMLEQIYQEDQLRQEQRIQLEADVPLLKKFPITKLKELGVITVRNKGVEQLRELLNFFRVASLEEWDRIYKQDKLSVAFKISLAQSKKAEAISAWLRYGEIQASRLPLKPYDAKKFKATLKLAKQLSISEPTGFDKLQALCTECGVALALTPSFPTTATYGSTRWIKGRQHPLIQISDRGKRADNAWFAFFHEAGHVLLHGKTEDEANLFARDFLLGDFPIEHYQKIGDRYWEIDEIDEIADKYGIQTGILIGQLQRVGSLPHSVFREHIPKVNFTG
jgi:HTH-type transcriptional regulator/antitoxin HigA